MKGAASAYAADCLVRHLLRMPGNLPPAAKVWAAVLELGFDPTASDLVIAAGIGVLTITPTTIDWRPTVAPTRSTPPIPADDATRTARQAACNACPRFVDRRCTVAGCGCAGQGQPAVYFSKCPLGKWPAVPPIPSAIPPDHVAKT